MKPDNYNLTANDMFAIRKHRDAFVHAMRESSDSHYANIMHELMMFESLSPIERARHSVIFSIVSPRCPITRNAIVTPIIVRAIMEGVRDAETIRSILVAHGIGLQNMKSTHIAGIAERLATLTSASMVRDILADWPGLSFKTASMAVALYDAHAKVYTLDTHMIRWARAIAGLSPETGSHTCSSAKRYRELESFLIGIAEEHCNDVPLFLTQWAVWNDAGFAGEHQTHLPIFGLVG